MSKKLIAFGLNGTLSVSREPVPEQMTKLIVRLAATYDICIITGETFSQCEQRLLARLRMNARAKQRVHILSTYGTCYHKYDSTQRKWIRCYAEDLTSDQKRHIVGVIIACAKELGLWSPRPYGASIDDRYSQITYSALGQDAPIQKKYLWAERHGAARKVLRRRVAARLAGYEVRLGGTTSLDVMRSGVNKLYGMKLFLGHSRLRAKDIIYISSRLGRGDSDYDLRELDMSFVEVGGYQDTAYVLEGILSVGTQQDKLQ